MDWLNDSSAFGNALSAGSAAWTMIQWMISTRHDASRMTIENYLEWLRRKDHKEVLASIEANREQALQLLEDLKESVLRAIVSHEINSQERHNDLKSTLEELLGLDLPRLKLRMPDGVIQSGGGRETVRFRVDFEVINESRSEATIRRGEAVLIDGDEEVKAFLHPGSIPGGVLRLNTHRGADSFFMETRDLLLKGRNGRKPTFKFLSLDVIQFDSPLRFVEGNGITLRREN